MSGGERCAAAAEEPEGRNVLGRTFDPGTVNLTDLPLAPDSDRPAEIREEAFCAELGAFLEQNVGRSVDLKLNRVQNMGTISAAVAKRLQDIESFVGALLSFVPCFNEPNKGVLFRAEVSVYVSNDSLKITVHFPAENIYACREIALDEGGGCARVSGWNTTDPGKSLSGEKRKFLEQEFSWADLMKMFG